MLRSLVSLGIWVIAIDDGSGITIHARAPSLYTKMDVS